MSAAETIQDHRDDQIEMSMINPSLVRNASMGDAERAKLKDEIFQHEERMKIMDRQAMEFAQERRKFAGMLAAQKTKESSGKRRGRGRGKLKKTEFSAQRSDLPEETKKIMKPLESEFTRNPMKSMRPKGAS